MAENFIDTPAEPEDSRLQMVAAVMLGLAAILTALAAYNSALKGGDAVNLRTDAGRSLADANFFYAQDTQETAQDQSLFVQYAQASFQGDTDLADYLTSLMRPQLAEAITWWSETDEAVTPFDEIEGNPYYAEGAQESLGAANDLQDEADGQVAKADVLDEQADKFDLATVLLALTLFFGGIATLFRSDRVTMVILATGVVTLVAGGTVFVDAM